MGHIFEQHIEAHHIFDDASDDVDVDDGMINISWHLSTQLSQQFESKCWISHSAIHSHFLLSNISDAEMWINKVNFANAKIVL